MFPQGKYKTIYIDPPWPEHGGGKIKRGADRHYALMSIKEIKALPIASLADPEGCHTAKILPQAHAVFAPSNQRNILKAPCPSHSSASGR